MSITSKGTLKTQDRHMVTEKRNPNDLCTREQSASTAYLLVVLWSDLALARTKATRLSSTLNACSLHACSLHD